MKKLFLTAAAAGCLWIAPALADPSPSLIDGLRQESQSSRLVMREAVSFCRETLYPSSPRQAVYQCADRMQAALSMATVPIVAAELKAVERARTVAGIAGLTNVDVGRTEATKALPVFLDFLSALDAADRPAKPKKKQ